MLLGFISEVYLDAIDRRPARYESRSESGGWQAGVQPRGVSVRTDNWRYGAELYWPERAVCKNSFTGLTKFLISAKISTLTRKEEY